MSTAEKFLAEIESYLQRTGMSATAFGVAAVNDGHFVRELRDGKDVKASTMDRVRHFMAEGQARRRPNRQASACAA